MLLKTQKVRLRASIARNETSKASKPHLCLSTLAPGPGGRGVLVGKAAPDDLLPNSLDKSRARAKLPCMLTFSMGKSLCLTVFALMIMMNSASNNSDTQCIHESKL